jgi:hypothetical protein
MKRFLLVAAVLGLILAIGFIGHEGFAAVVEAFAAVGWGLAAVVLLRAVQIAGAGLGWWCVFPDARPPLTTCINVRFTREAINTLLPVAQIGGEIAGARLMTLHGIPEGSRAQPCWSTCCCRWSRNSRSRWSGSGCLRCPVATPQYSLPPWRA